MTDHPKAKGDRTTLAVMLGLHEAGFAVSVPFGENTRYDLIIDDGTSLARVQCKTGRLRLGGIRWATCSSYAHHPNPRMVQRDYIGEIDYFAVYCPETAGVYLIPIAEAQLKRMGILRVEPARNNQRRFIRLASDYQIGRIEIDPTVIGL
jgi:PD-(D/E)XK nuclease superfamily protein